MKANQLAKWLHDNYEQLAKANDWQTQSITRVEFDNLPAENKSTMIALADKMLNTFQIIDTNFVVMRRHGDNCKELWSCCEDCEKKFYEWREKKATPMNKVVAYSHLL